MFCDVAEAWARQVQTTQAFGVFFSTKQEQLCTRYKIEVYTPHGFPSKYCSFRIARHGCTAVEELESPRIQMITFLEGKSVCIYLLFETGVNSEITKTQGKTTFQTKNSILQLLLDKRLFK